MRTIPAKVKIRTHQSAIILCSCLVPTTHISNRVYYNTPELTQQNFAAVIFVNICAKVEHFVGIFAEPTCGAFAKVR